MCVAGVRLEVAGSYSCVCVAGVRTYVFNLFVSSAKSVRLRTSTKRVRRYSDEGVCLQCDVVFGREKQRLSRC